MSEKLANVFDVEHHDVVLSDQESTQVVVPANTENAEDSDMDFARSNYYEIIDQSKAAINTAMRIAAESENPRAIEVLSGLLKNAADINRQLVQMNKDRQDVKIAKNAAKTAPSSGSTQQLTQHNNIIMTGSLQDITKLLKDQQI
jgi:ABC-type proline/glycine betaine transport system substrate-binding protein